MTDEWECFSDPAYYDMWCVRQVGSRTFGEGFHLVNGDEAKMLCRFLNTRPADRIEAQAAEIEFHKERADALALQADEWEGKYLIGIAEIERLRSVIDATALHWLALQDKHPIQWEGAIDGAMAAACAEIERLREALGELSGNTGKLPIRENENG